MRERAREARRGEYSGAKRVRETDSDKERKRGMVGGRVEARVSGAERGR